MSTPTTHLHLDPEVAAALAATGTGLSTRAGPPPGDVAACRAPADFIFAAIQRLNEPVDSDVDTQDFHVPSADGHSVLLRLYTKHQASPTTASPPGPAAIYLHGGAFIMGSVKNFDWACRMYASRTGVPFLAVDYRLAPEHPYPLPVDDVYAALAWLSSQAPDLGIDPHRIGIMGESAGAGLAAMLAIRVRERLRNDPMAPHLARQILLYPMLDDRRVSEADAPPGVLQFAAIKPADVWTGWNAFLGPLFGGDEVPEEAAPGRLADAAGMPELYLEVGGLDVFVTEDVEYALKHVRAGVPTELYVRPGVTHGWDMVTPRAQVTRRAMEDRCRAVRTIGEGK